MESALCSDVFFLVYTPTYRYLEGLPCIHIYILFIYMTPLHALFFASVCISTFSTDVMLYRLKRFAPQLPQRKSKAFAKRRLSPKLARNCPAKRCLLAAGRCYRKRLNSVAIRLSSSLAKATASNFVNFGGYGSAILVIHLPFESWPAKGT